MSTSTPAAHAATFTSTELFDRDALRKIVSNWRNLPVPLSTRRDLDGTWFERGAEWRPFDLVRAYLEEGTTCLPPSGSSLPGAPSYGAIEVRYRRAGVCATTGRGRQFSVGPSLQRLPRSVRHTIAGGLYHDIDMVNAHPVLLSQYCARFGIAAPTVDEYAGARRETMLAELGVPRNEGKRAIISLLNGGRRACEDLPRRPAWLAALAHEVKRIHGVLVSEERHSTVVDAARRRVAAGNGSNLGGSVLAAVVSEIEDAVLMAMVAYLRDRGVATDGLVLVFDGFMVQRAALAEAGFQAVDAAFLADLSDAARTATGYSARLLEKPMDEAIDLSTVTYMAADVLWSPLLGGGQPPHKPIAANPNAPGSDGHAPLAVVVARPVANTAWSADRTFARFSGAAAVSEHVGTARACEPLYEVIADPSRAVRVFFRLSFSTLHAPASVVVEQFMRAAVEPVVCGYFGACAAPLRADVSAAHSAVTTTVRIVLPVRALTLVDCFVVCARVQDRAVAMSERFPALRMAGADRALMDAGVYEEGTQLPIVGTLDPATAQTLTVYAGAPDAGGHLVTVCPETLPLVSTSVGRTAGDIRGLRLVSRKPERAFTAAELARYAAFLNSWDAIPAVFGAPIAISAISCVDGAARVELAPGTPCPIEGCAPKNPPGSRVGAPGGDTGPDGNTGPCVGTPDLSASGPGRIWVEQPPTLVVDDRAMTARVHCSHPRCRGREIILSDAAVSTTDALDRVRTRTLHAQEGGIAWGDRYCEPEMRPFPAPERAAFVCVRAQMGLGKTKAIVEYLRRTCTEATRVLVISYSVELSRRTNQLLSEGSGLDFELYSDKKGDLWQPRVTVCLDSLRRCALSAYDLVVVDEVQSVLAHFDSPLMRETGAVSHKLERVLAASKCVLLVDAACDSTLVKLAVDRLETLRGERAFWVRNDFVRPTNRRVTLCVADRRQGPRGALSRESLRFAATNATFRRLGADENVVHVSNIKSHVVAVEKAFRRQYPTEPVAAYYSQSPRRLRDPAAEWPGMRLLTYSPTITAGISFEAQHFHALVAYFEISPHAPGVETIVQMLWRVRDLSGGSMEVFFQTPAGGPVVQPHTTREVRAMLVSGYSLTKRYLDDHGVRFEAVRVLSDDGRALFDRERLSWAVLVGTVVTRNRSLVRGIDLFTRTMDEDYGVAVDVQTIAATEDLDSAIALEIAAQCATPDAPVPFADVDLSLDEARASEIREEFAREGVRDAVLAASLKTYLVRVRWEISRERVDAEFYTKYVVDPCGHRTLSQLRCWTKRQEATSAQLREQLGELLTRTLQRADPNLEVHKHSRRSHKMLVHAQEVLEAVVTPAETALLTSFKAVAVKSTAVGLGVGTVLAKYTKSEISELSALFFDKPGPRDPYPWFRKVTEATFGLTVERGSKNRSRPKYNDIWISSVELGAVVAKYKPAFTCYGFV